MSPFETLTDKEIGFSHSAADLRREEGMGPACGSHRSPNISSLERWLSLGGGVAMAAFGLARGGGRGLVLAALGGGLMYRGYTAHCACYDALGIDTAEHNEATVVPAQQGCKVETSLTINRSAQELYGFWREIDILSNVLRHVCSVESLDRNRSHWSAEGPMGVCLEWDAEIFNDRENEMIAWRSLPGGDVDTAGSIHFKPLPHGRGTAVTVSLKYNPPLGGRIRGGIATLLGDGLEQKIRDDLRNFKRVMETGEIPTTSGQARGGA